MKERLDITLRYSIFIYTIICFAGIYAAQKDLNREIWELINLLAINTCRYDSVLGAVCWTKYYQFIPLALLIIIRYVVYGKTYQK